MRGKVSVVCNPLEVGIGSPPPMRGKAVGIVKSKSCARITPAYAGKSQSRGNAACVRKDHPRLCGEKLSDAVSSLLTLGSPPPMRGKGARVKVLPLMIGITPAYAGKRFRCLLCRRSLGDHPRLCGEKTDLTISMLNKLGSPPPMRGKVYQRRSVAVIRWDHPRLCGEKFCAAVMPSMLAGSPPPMRGKVQLVIFAGVVHGITPAYAGKRRTSSILLPAV